MELAPHKITVNCVCPGDTISEGLEVLGQNYMKKAVEAIPLKRLGNVKFLMWYLASFKKVWGGSSCNKFSTFFL